LYRNGRTERLIALFDRPIELPAFVLSLPLPHTQPDPPTRHVHPQQAHVDYLTDLYHVERVLDRAVRKLRDVDQAILLHVDVHDVADGAGEPHG
jgi:hypothetical protein